jgi:hypothetical protein
MKLFVLLGAVALAAPLVAAAGQAQLEATPVVRAIFEQPFDVSPEWKIYKLGGKADQAYPAGGLNAVFHLGCAKQTIDLGPVCILDYGQ